MVFLTCFFVFFKNKKRILGECKEGENCNIFKKMRDEDEFTKKNYQHCEEYSHKKCRVVKCRDWKECPSYRRLVHGGYALHDLCHLKVFIHPVRMRESQETM